DYENAMAGVPAIFDKRYFDSLISLNGDRGAKALIQTRRDDVLAITPLTPLVDIDTKETYLALI
ncbi:MAG: nucleotidyltransferase family protein, partial [Pseudomonadota bacterium]